MVVMVRGVVEGDKAKMRYIQYSQLLQGWINSEVYLFVSYKHPEYLHEYTTLFISGMEK